MTLTSPDRRFDSLYLSNYATIRLKDEIARLPGVGNVNVFGAGQYSMRVWLDPEQDAGARPDRPGRHPGAAAAERAGHGRPDRHAAGAEGQSFQYTLDVSSRLNDPEQFANVIVKTGDGGDLTRVSDVGRVELGAQTYGQLFNLDGKQAAGLAIFQSPGANALDVATEVSRRMETLAREFPQGMDYAIPFDTTTFVSRRSTRSTRRSSKPPSWC